MTLIAWNENLSVGIEEINGQHKRIIDLINSVHSAMLDGRSQENISFILNSLIDYTKTHFAFEENLFTQYGYPEAATHNTAHTNLTAKVMEYKLKFDSGETIVGIEILKFLKDWLIQHIVGTDKRYAPFLNERGVK